MTTEWNAPAYHRVSDPQFAWGLRVLDRMPLAGRERVLDAGCGSGRLTSALLDRLPDGRVIALDRSRAMLLAARETLGAAGQAGDDRDGRVAFLMADLARLPLRSAVDAVFSTATFHWVLDHEAMFAGIHQALRPGGRVVAQCGGEGNLDRVHARAKAMLAAREWRGWFEGWQEPWNFASPEATRARLEAAGFGDVRTWREEMPTTFADAGAFAAFVAPVVLRAHLARLPDEARRTAFVGALTRAAAADDPPFTLDYVRLNIEARRP